MNSKNTETLLAEYPWLYRGYHKPITETCMCWGFSCDDGWFSLLRRLSRAIQDHLEENPHLADFEVLQVKEKFGARHFYYRGGDEFIEGLVARAEATSKTICELTGEPGRLCVKTGPLSYWYKTLCKEKAQELGYEPVE